MSKLFVEQVVNGNKTIVSEWNDNEQGAKVAFHNLCVDLLNDANTDKALVQITDETMNKWNGYREDIDKTDGYLAYDAETEYTKGSKVSYNNVDYIYINDKPGAGIIPTNTDYWKVYTPNGKLYVLKVSNDNLVIDQITEWIPNNAGKKGALADYHTKCASMWNAPDVITANVKILNENLDTWMQKSEYIYHIVEPEE